MKIRILFIIAAILSTVFIFNNSLQDASHSDADSDTIVSFILGDKTPTNEKDPVRFIVTKTVRKSAHFLEFALQGFLLAGCFSAPFKKKALWVLILGLLTGCTDEFIQLFSDGRAGLVSDVLIDFIGTTVGLFIFTIASRYRRKRVLKLTV